MVLDEHFVMAINWTIAVVYACFVIAQCKH